MHRAAAPPLTLLVALASACTSRPARVESDVGGLQKPRVTGTVTYRQRIALTPGSTVRVALEDVSRADAPATLIAEQTIRPEGQVPIPFTLEYDPARIDAGHRYAVRAQIRDADGRLRWSSTESHGVLTQGGPSRVQIVVHPVSVDAGGQGAQAAPERQTLVYQCDGLDFAVRQGPGAVEVHLPDRMLVLPQVRAASGAKYQDGDVTFWSNGDEALLELGAERYAGCRLNRARAPWEDARLRGVRFRAVGNEPGWHLEIEPGRQIALVTDYGANRIFTPVPTPATDAAAGRTTYHATTEAHDLRVTIDDTPCQDSMSGAQFPSGVTVVLDGRRYVGCGRALGPAFTGTWRLASFGEGGAAQPPAAGSPVTLEVDPWDRAAGSSGCNRFTGPYATERPGSLSFGRLASTLRACMEPLMSQEMRFLRALERTTGYLLRRGTLTLTDADGQVLLVFTVDGD